MAKKPSSWEVRILSATYHREGDGAVVEVYGVTREGEGLVALYKDFKPYFIVCEASQDFLDEMKIEAVEISRISLWVDGAERECHKISIEGPWDIPQYRNRAYKRCRKVLSADIPFAHRFIYDMGIESCTTVHGNLVDKGEQRKHYTTKYVVETLSFSSCDPFNPFLSVFSFDIENSIVDKHLYTICYVFESGSGRVEGKICGESNGHGPEDEKRMLEEFVDKIHEMDPDIITGYNIDNYDLPQIEARAHIHGVKLDIGRDHSTPTRINEQFWRVHGRIVADAWWSAKMALRPKKETLNHLSKILLGEEKMDVDPRKIEEEWSKDPEKVKDYCLKDADLALRIVQKIDVIDRNLDLATVSKLPLDDVLNGRTSTLIDSLVIRRADERGIGVPMNTYGTKRKKIEGGYVHVISPGIYDWVCVLDFKSMYPSLMIAKNICMTTMDPEGDIVSPLGVRFVSSETRKGLVPELLEGLMKDRDEAKRKVKNASNPEEKMHYDSLQEAIKVLMNSFYGVFASSFYRLTDPQIGASITAYAREGVKSVIGHLEEERVKVIYGDTDSIFFQSPKEDLQSAVEFGQEVAKRFSLKGMTLEFEKLLNPMYSHGKKKRYVGKVVWPEEDVIVRGYESRRTDAFDFQSNALTAVFERILEHDEKGAVSLAKELVDETRQGSVPNEQLVISRTCKDFKFYKDPDTQATVQTAKKMQKIGMTFVPGMKVSWIVVNSRRQPQQVEPWVEGTEIPQKPDYEYYAERVAATLARATEVFGVDERELLTGASQSTLFDGWGSTVPGEEKSKGEPKGNTRKKGAKKDEENPGDLEEQAKKGKTTLKKWF